MKHKVTIMTEVEKKGLFGKKKVMEKRNIEVDGKTYRKLKQQQKNKPYTLEEMFFYDEIFGD